MQKFYTDKPKLFECNISVEGANINKTKARLILEFPDKKNLLFYCDLDSNGKCSVTIPALKGVNECTGNVLLEIIAESTHFESWNDGFELKTNKKVQVEMIEPKKKIIENESPRVEVIMETVDDNPENPIFDKFTNYINDNKIHLDTIIKNKTEFFNLLYEYRKDNDETKENIVIIVEELKKVTKANKIDKLLHL